MLAFVLVLLHTHVAKADEDIKIEDDVKQGPEKDEQKIPEEYLQAFDEVKKIISDEVFYLSSIFNCYRNQKIKRREWLQYTHAL